jgi:hypothetical protein
MALTQTHLRTYEQKLAAVPSPSLLIEVLNVLFRNAVLSSKVVTVVISHNLIRVARTIAIRLRTKIRHIVAGATDMLFRHQFCTKP